MRPAPKSAWERRLLGHARFLAGAALSVDLFDELGEELGRDFGGRVIVSGYAPSGSLVEIRSPHFPARALEDYRLLHAPEDPYPRVVRENGLSNRTIRFSDCLRLPALEGTGFYATLSKPSSKARPGLALCVEIEGEGWTSIAIIRDRDFTDAEVSRLEQLRPFVTAALLLRHLASRAGARPKALEALSSPAERREASRLNLTRTEGLVLRELLEGLRYAEIAHRLGMSPHTVHAHVKAIHSKAGVESTGRLRALLVKQRA